MRNGRAISAIDLISRWILNLTMINFMWFLFLFSGLFIFGFFPATVAALGVSRKLILANGQKDIWLWKTFKDMYKKAFVFANLTGWAVLAIGMVLYINFRLIESAQNEMYFFIPFAFYFVAFVYLIMVIWLFPLYIHYEATWKQHIKNALIFGIGKIHYTMTIIIFVSAVVYLSLEFPSLIVFFSIGLTSTLVMWVMLSAFRKIDKLLVASHNN
ncbi:YesL family protein [Amphibacillus jilinensis]|uniref:YesL family protein n=1 Tax=Amphibacillus jilinensis TaxID=1216008 RepID=UPI0002F1E2B3|nr:DUF624 domain-containing protein [Amphibacillus jilinensis]